MLEAGSGVMCCLRLGVLGADSTGLTLDLFSFLSYLIMVPIPGNWKDLVDHVAGEIPLA